ncbi:MAG: hypothetical protein ACK47B_27480 [Armatimonadota bacterium]
MPDALGEVIRSESQLLEIQCHKLYCAPPFGSFARIDCSGGEITVFAVVTQVSTAPFDSNRLVQAHGLPPGELEQKKPHLPTLFRTVFHAQMVGYRSGDVLLAGTPPRPPRLHSYAYPAEEADVRAVTESPSFLRSLTQVTEVPLEDLLVSALGAARDASGPEAGGRLVTWGKYLARLLARDYVTLEGVLRRVSPPSTLPPLRPAAVPARPSAAPPAGNGPGWEAPLPLAGSPVRRSLDPFEDA